MKRKIDRDEFPDMNTLKHGHRVTVAEHNYWRRALGKPGRPLPSRMGRPLKGEEKFIPISLRLPPKVLAWAKARGERLSVGYQTVIKDALLRLSNRSV